jgi:hypothetical protein
MRVDRLIFASRRLAANGLDTWQEVLERGYEGLLAKDELRRTVVAGRSRGSRSGNGRTGWWSVAGSWRAVADLSGPAR